MTPTRRIYVASSWRNPDQPDVVRALREAGHQVYDFRNPRAGDNGFHWSEIDPDWKQWTREEFRAALGTRIAIKGYVSDRDAMEWADVGVLVLPAGRSAHLEAGYFAGAPGKQLHILMAPHREEPELMYLMAAGGLHLHIDELTQALSGVPV